MQYSRRQNTRGISLLAVILLTAFFIYLPLTFAETRIPGSRFPSYKPNNSQFISQTVPLVMQPGQRYKVSLTFKNTGKTAWAYPNYLLISQNPPANNTWSVRLEMAFWFKIR